MAQKITDKQALQIWNEYVENIRKSTALLTGESEVQQRKRIAQLEADNEAWFAYYFPSYCYAPPAEFHKKSSRLVMSKMELYLVREWSRELSKSTRTMMEILKLCLTGKKKYVLMISNSFDNAERLLMPYKANLQGNQRIINDYGMQELPGNWTSSEFTTRKGVAFRALGAGQSPRGTRNEEARPDVILFDDLDTDEDCRNTDIIEKKWRWIEDAAIGTRSISNPLTVIFCGNKIAKDCCVVRAEEFADKVETINIRDGEGKSTWPEKNSEEHIDRVLSQKSYLSIQREYFNNPIEDGSVFKEVTYGKCPPLSSMQFVVAYGDPAPSNKDRPTQRAKAQNSCKAVVIVGYKDFKFYVYKVFVDVTTNATFVDWLYATQDFVQGKTQLYIFIENNTLQDPFYQQVLLPLIYEKGKQKGGILGVKPDDRKKPDKYFRIEGTLEPLNRLGLLVLNIAEKDDPNMKRLETQFKSVSANSKTMDGPDAVEGAVHKVKNMVMVQSTGAVTSIPRKPNNKRF